jgi:hypothetical protein
MSKRVEQLSQQLGVIPSLVIGAGLFVLGTLAAEQVTNTYWPFDVQRLDLVRGVALDRADAAALLQAANMELILVFLTAVLVAITGLALPFAYFLNMRFGRRGRPRLTPPPFLLTLRQSMWVGLWAAFCAWLQMNRTLGLAVAILVAVVLILFEMLLQLRQRASSMSAARNS